MSGKERLNSDDVPHVYHVDVREQKIYNYISNNCDNRPIKEEHLPVEYARLLERFFNMRQAYTETLDKLECAIAELNGRKKK